MDLKRQIMWSTIYSGLPIEEVADILCEKTAKRAVQ